MFRRIEPSEPYSRGVKDPNMADSGVSIAEYSRPRGIYVFRRPSKNEPLPGLKPSFASVSVSSACVAARMNPYRD